MVSSGQYARQRPGTQLEQYVLVRMVTDAEQSWAESLPCSQPCRRTMLSWDKAHRRGLTEALADRENVFTKAVVQ